MADPLSSIQSRPLPLFTPVEPPKKQPAEKKPASDLEYVPDLAGPLATPKPAPALTSTAADSDLTHWPDALLEQNARALGGRLSRDPKSVTGAERELLARMEAEVSARDAKRSAAGKAPVLLCERPADLPLNGALGLSHWWLRTPTKEMGMGLKGGGVPGHAGGPSGYPGAPTTLNDHKGEVATSCARLDDVDPECIDRALVLGKDTGRWLPPVNDCHTTVQKIVEGCAKPGTKPMTTKYLQESDAGVP
jgi:hypothetical protein